MRGGGGLYCFGLFAVGFVCLLNLNLLEGFIFMVILSAGIGLFIGFIAGYFIGKNSAGKDVKVENAFSGKKESNGGETKTNIYVGNISPDTEEKDIKEIFEVFGNVKKVSLHKDSKNFLKRFAFVEMENRDDAASAVTSLNGREVNGRVIKVSFAYSKQRHGRRKYSSGSRRNYGGVRKTRR